MHYKEKLLGFTKKSIDYIKLARLEIIVLVAVIIFDLVTKSIVASVMKEGQSIELIPNFLYFTFVINTKAAFGSAFGLENFLGDEGIRIVFLIFTGLAMLVFLFLMYRAKGKHKLLRLALALIIAGGLGNFFDRLFLKGVRDFVEIVYFGLDLGFLGTSFAIFNMADAALTAGVVMFLVFYLFIYKEPKKAVPKLVESETVPTEADDVQQSENAGDQSEVNQSAIEGTKEPTDSTVKNNE